jgi:HD-GYP domain-containing protein (c-di-GMP phosphodiesterase class II)
VRSHHERCDGDGYPHGLAGAAIALAARVVSAADVFDAITQPRGYRSGRPFDAALEEIRRESGALFVPDVAARVRRPEVVARWRDIFERGRADEATIAAPAALA